MVQDESNPSANSGQSKAITGAITEINQEFKEKEVQQKAREIGVPYIDITGLPINDDLLRIIPEAQSQEGALIPFFQVGKKLRIAVLDPEKKETKSIISELKEKNYILNINLCSPYALSVAQKNYLRIKKKNTDVKKLESEMLDQAKNIAQEIRQLADIPEKFEEIQSDLALAILHRKAISLNASDIHLETKKRGIRVRGRIDGVLQDFFILSHSIAKGIIRQIKFSAGMKSNIPGIPSDGQLTFSAGKRRIMVRVSILPGEKGESIVMRYLDPQTQKKKLGNIGFSIYEQKKIDSLKSLRQGLILVTGPTGSGKTTTLYSILKELNTPEKKIITLEDPVEYEEEGIVQSSINEDKGYTFASGLKSCLRQDPDILLIGEIRDIDTAKAALQASLTGHLVLSTLHTNSAIDTIVRLRDLGVQNYLLSSALRGIIAQRLVRKPCLKCRKKKSFSKEQKKILLNILKPYVQNGEVLPNLQEKMWKGVGCKDCAKTGYKGRIVLSETIVFSNILLNKIAAGESISLLRKYLISTQQKFFDFDAAIKILQGQTDFDEVVRVLGNKFIP